MANHGLNQYFRVVDLSDRLIVWFSHKTGDSMVANLGWFSYERDVRQIGYRIMLLNPRKTTEFLISY